MKTCPNCTAPLKYNLKEKLYGCEYCRGKFNLKPDISEKDLYVYECLDCHAKLLVGTNLDVNSCIYCASKHIEKLELDDDYNPGKIIPFKYNKKEAYNIFKKSYKGRFIPKEFKNKKIINKLYGIYIPTLLYDYDAYGEIEFDAKRMSNWKSGSYKYTKEDSYTAVRKGSMKLEKIAVYSKGNIIDDISPYDYDDIKEFSKDDLNGYLIEEFKLSKNDANNQAKDKARIYYTERMKKDLIGYNKVSQKSSSIDLENTNKIFVLLPVWVLSIKYKGKTYNFTINGETGKMKGSVPLSKNKFIFNCIMSFLVTFILLFIFYYLKVIL